MSIFSSHVGRWEEGGYGSLLFTPAVRQGCAAACQGSCRVDRPPAVRSASRALRGYFRARLPALPCIAWLARRLDCRPRRWLQAPPGLIASGMPWLSGRRYKEMVTRYPDACVVLVLTRDQGSGERAGEHRALGLPRRSHLPAFCASRGPQCRLPACSELQPA